jgi:tetratricopeptide (TPR) repeat protein
MRLHTFRTGLMVASLLACAASSAAQAGRVSGIVRDDDGQAIKGAIVTAENPNRGLSSLTATTDDRGRFTMIGLAAGQWRFLAQAPGHAPGAGEMNVRFGTPNPPLMFALRRNGPSVDAPLANIAAKDLQTQLAAADSLYKQSQWDQAIAAYRAILSQTPALSIVNLQIAAAYRNKKDYDAALAAYADLLRVDPENEKAAVGLGATHLEKGDAAAAEDVLSKAVSGPAAGRELFFSLGELKAARGDMQQASEWYAKAAAADPAWGKPRYKLGLLASESGDNGRASALMTEVMAVDPTSPEAALAKAALDQWK